MPHLQIHHEKMTQEIADQLVALCPFSALEYSNQQLEINAGCKMCGICVKKGPLGIITLEDDAAPKVIDKQAWQGVAVFAEQRNGKLHNVTLELLGKARELASVTQQPVLAVLIGNGLTEAAQTLIRYGADKVYIYEDSAFEDFNMTPYVNAFADFVEKVKPSSVLVGATNLGRSLAPRVAARFHTGLTADCTVLEMKENSDLVQIRPAFGGNIMAQIVTENHRPQFCTVRYKIFSVPHPLQVPTGKIYAMTLRDALKTSPIEIISYCEKPQEMDISEAETIIAVGRGIKSQADLEMVRQLAAAFGAQLACTRPLVENGWFDVRHQIGLSGRTVNAKLIITIGISGSVQFAAGMRNSSCIVAINQDPNATIFDIAHYGIVGDLYDVVPILITQCAKEVQYEI